jgi:hypothetical protein
MLQALGCLIDALASLGIMDCWRSIAEREAEPEERLV